MKIYLQKLPGELKKGLQPVYLIAGDEPLLVQEAADQIANVAAQQGLIRERVYVEKGFDWGNLHQTLFSQGLFANKQLVDVKLQGHKPGVSGGKLIAEYCERPAPDTVLVITTSKLDAAQQRTSWVKAITKHGLFIPVYPLEGRFFLSWLNERLRAANCQATPDAVQLLAERSEGNLLAAHQSIEKLSLLGHQKITADIIDDVTSNTSRFDIFKLSDSVLSRDLKRTTRILQHLASEGIAPVLVLWALTRELRSLIKLAQAPSLEVGMQQQRVFEKRKPLLRQFMQRKSVKKLMRLLSDAATIDRMIKGVAPGEPWMALERFCYRIAL